MYKRILVSGGTGLLGTGIRSITHEYPESEFKFFSSRECDLTNLDNLLRYIDKYNPDAFIHTAALAGGVHYTQKYPATILRNNILMDMNVLEAQRQCGIGKVILTLSTGMYSPLAMMPIKEEYIHDGCPHTSNFSYAFAKRLVHPLITSYRKEYDVNVIGLIPNCIFGENMNYEIDKSLVIAGLIRRFYENRSNSEPIIIWGDGMQLREYTYSRDMARAYLWCLNNYNEDQIIHVGSVEEYTIKFIAYAIADILGIEHTRLVFDITKPTGVDRKSTNNSKFIERSNFKYTPFYEGLKNSIKWFEENYETQGAVRL
jgi:GDP-L-fucose synthase